MPPHYQFELTALHGTRVLAVPALPGVFALAEEGQHAWVITHERQLVRLDLNTLSAQPLRFSAGTPSAISADPRGRWIAVGTEEQRVVVLDAASGSILRTFNNNLAAISVLRFSPDGRWLAAGDRDARVFSSASGWQSQDTPSASPPRPHGATIVWETESWQRAHTLDARRAATITALHFDVAGEFLYVEDKVEQNGQWTSVLSAWRLADGQLHAEETLPALGKEAQYLAAASVDGATGEIYHAGALRASLRTCVSGYPSPIDANLIGTPPAALHRTRDGAYWVLARADGVLIATTPSGVAVARLLGPRGTSAVMAMYSDAQGKYLYAVGADKNLWRWSLTDLPRGDRAEVSSPVSAATAVQRAICYRPTSASVSAAAFKLDTQFTLGRDFLLTRPRHDPTPTADIDLTESEISLVLTSGNDVVRERWHLPSQQRVCQSRSTPADPDAAACRISVETGKAPARFFLTERGQAGARRDVIVDRVFQREVWSRDTAHRKYPVPFMTLGAESFLLADGRAVYTWRAGERQAVFRDPYSDILAVALSPDGRYAVLFHPNRGRYRLSMLNLTSGQIDRQIEHGDVHRVLTDIVAATIRFSPDGTRLLLHTRGIRDNEQAVILDVPTGKVLHESPVIRPTAAASMPLYVDAAMQRRVELSPRSNRMRVHVVGDAPAIYELGRHRLFADVLAISTSGTWLASGGYDGSVKLWDLAAGRESTVWQGPNSAVLAMRFAGDARLAVWYADGKVQVLSLRQGDDPHER